MTALTYVSAAPYRKPSTGQTAKIALGQGLTGADLERVRLGHQAGVLKVQDRAGVDRFAKSHNGVVGIDGRELARLSPESRDAILKALDVSNPSALAGRLMADYSRLSRAHALAVLGVLAYPGERSADLPEPARKKVLDFLRARLQPAEDNIVRRQAVVALAIQPATDSVMVAAMLNFLRRDHNAWNTAGVVQFFAAHKEQVRGLPDYAGVLKQLEASGNPHAGQISRELEAAEDSTETP